MFADATYLKHHGRPVLFSFGYDGLTDAEWSEVLPADRKSGPIYLSEHRRRPNADGAFDWPIPGEGIAATRRFFKESANLSLRVPVAYPRFHDVYAEAKVHPSYGRIGDDNGKTFATTLQNALKSGAPFIQIATWNDWGEGTQVEPSTEFRYRDLETIQRSRREWSGPAFVAEPGDLRLCDRLYRLRKAKAARGEALDEWARLIAEGRFSAARKTLGGIDP
jgi:hypothetical protein